MVLKKTKKFRAIPLKRFGFEKTAKKYFFNFT
jgi:hypothetical protein